MATVDGGRKTVSCPGQRHNGLYRPGYGGGTEEISEAPRCHRGAIDDRNERGRGFVRLWQDVSAASGQECPRDEEGGGIPHAVHGGGKRAARQLSLAGKSVACDGQGRCP